MLARGMGIQGLSKESVGPGERHGPGGGTSRAFLQSDHPRPSSTVAPTVAVGPSVWHSQTVLPPIPPKTPTPQRLYWARHAHCRCETMLHLRYYHGFQSPCLLEDCGASCPRPTPPRSTLPRCPHPTSPPLLPDFLLHRPPRQPMSPPPQSVQGGGYNGWQEGQGRRWGGGVIMASGVLACWRIAARRALAPPHPVQPSLGVPILPPPLRPDFLLHRPPAIPPQITPPPSSSLTFLPTVVSSSLHALGGGG